MVEHKVMRVAYTICETRHRISPLTTSRVSHLTSMKVVSGPSQHERLKPLL